jgi:drug/metabolite transporter (DMT)-like permease
MDAFAKLASATIPVGQTLAFRFGVQSLLLLPVAALLGVLSRPGARDLQLHLVRALLIVIATWAFFTALRAMPIADAIAIFFVEPFILTLFGALFLAERIGWRRILACAVGFGGAMLVIRPSFSEFGPVAVMPLITAVCFAFYMILTRGMARRLHPVALQAWTALAASVLILPCLAVGRAYGVPALDPVIPQDVVWLFLLGVGITASVTHLMVSAALKYAPAATIAPLQYLEILGATLLGYLIFGDLPDTQTFLGIAIIIVSGLFVIWRERGARRTVAPAPAP